jgi:hypothetical protein
VKFITKIKDFDEIEKPSASYCSEGPKLNKISTETTINIPIME